MMSYDAMMSCGRQLCDSHGLHDWRISIENLGNRALYGPQCVGLMGYCDDPNKTIRVHRSLRDSFRQTMLHEIAHALTPGSGHGADWLKKAEEIGCTFRHLLPYHLRAEGSAFKAAVEM
jgi:hypothetical protein